MNIKLNLITDQQEELSLLAVQFNNELENPNTPPFPKAATLQALKEKLTAALFEQEGFTEIWDKAQTNAQLLCLSHEKTAIRNLPWQIVTEDCPLLAIAKSSKNDMLPHQPSIGYPLKVLVMVASPEGVTRLAYEEEELQLLRAFSPLMSQGLAQVHFTDDGSLENLAEKLNENKYHILHFTGHGSYHEGQGTLALEDPISGKQKNASAVEFNEILAKAHRKEHRPELVVLSACQTGQGVEAGNLSGVADTLMLGGIPSVIAMSASILDDCAAKFAAKLYAELSNGLPLPDAFQEARLAVRKFETTEYNLAKAGLAPGQWLIPQLLLNQNVAKLVDEDSPKITLDFKQDVKIIRGETALVNLRVRPDNYVFVGRRKEKRKTMLQLKDGNSILLRGQGGVGKTALAEHLAIRLLAADPKTKVFTFSEKTPAGQSLLDQMQNYLTKEKKQFSIVSELALVPKQTDKFFKLLEKVSEQCDPVFLFDNIESFQKFDIEKQIWIWHEEKHEDILQLMQILDEQSPFPLIITGRYPIAEFPDLEVCNMNTVPFGDFFRKCHQLGISELAQKLQTGTMPTSALKRTEGDKPPTFEEVIRLLHKTFGGNYRALEFFDELYTQKGEEIFKTLHKLADFESKLAEKEIKEGVLTRMSENLIFKELLTYLNAQDKDTLFVLAQFNIPVLPMAIGMQRNSEDRTGSLNKAVNLTLVERQKGVDGRERFYVMPLVRDLLKESGIEFGFEEKVAGDYHKYAVDSKVSEDILGEISEAFERYFSAKAVEEINEVGWRLCEFYYDIQQFRLSLAFGLRTEEIAKEKTYGSIWNILGIIFNLFGQLDFALEFYKKSLADNIKRGDRLGEGTSLNNLATTAHAQGDYDSALHYLQQSLKIMQEIGDRDGEGATLNNISQIHDAQGDYDTALQYLQQSLKITQEIGHRQGEGTTLNNISQIHSSKGDYDTALQYLQQSLKIQQEIGDRKGEGNTLNNISLVHSSKGDFNTALQYLQQSLKIHQEIGDRKGEGATLNNISQIHDAQGDYDTALQYLQQSLKITQEIGHRHGESTTLNNISLIHSAKGDYDTALQYLQQSLKIQQEIGHRDGEATTLNNISQIHDAKGDYNTALQYLQQSLKIQQEIGDTNGMASTVTNMGVMFFEQEKFEEAIPFLFQAYQIFTKIGSPKKQTPESYLGAIIEKIGEPRFQEIIKNLNQNS